MTTVSVTIQEDPVPVIVGTDTPKVTITDSLTGNVTVIQSKPVTVSAAEGNPTVIIHGNGSIADTSIMLDNLIGTLTRVQMTPELASDLSRLEDLWIRIGNELILTYPDGISIQEAGRNYTDTSITDTVADINVSVDGKIDIAYSSIDQKADSINQRVTDIKGETDGRLVVAESLITQTAESITSTVSRLDTIDGPGGSVELLQSSIDQTVDSITLEVSARQEVSNNLEEAKSSISLLTDSITLMSSVVDTLGNRMTSSEIILGADGINFTVLQEALGEQQYSISSVQTLLANRWGVVIEEDVNGNKYSSGFGLLVHPIWILNTSYFIGDTVFYQDKVYECTDTHLSTAIKSPNGVEGTNYWIELIGGVKSEFTVQAESFKILSPDGIQTIFSIGTDQKAYIKGELLVEGLESHNYGDPNESWFKLDPTTGLAEFNNISLVIGSGSSGYGNLIDKPAILADINAGEVAAIAASASEKADLAETQAKAYADGKITEEEVRAIEDAQAKADLAEAASKWYTDLQPVGANELLNANFELGYSGWFHARSEVPIDEFYSVGTDIDLNSAYVVNFGSQELVCTGDRYIENARYIPIDTAQIYSVAASIRCTRLDSIDSFNQIDVGVICYNKNYVILDQRHCCINNLILTEINDDFSLFEDKISGEGSLQSNFAVGTQYVRFFFRFNYAATADDGMVRISYAWFSEIDLGATKGAAWNTNIAGQPNTLAELDVSASLELQEALDNSIQAISDAATALATSDGRIVSFYQDDPPVGDMFEGDFWFDTNEGKKLYRYNGSAWVDAQDDEIATALDAAQTAQSTADGKAIIFYNTEIPTTAAIGDLWYDTDDPLKTLRRFNGTDWDVVATYGSTWNIDIVGQPNTLADLDTTASLELQDALTNSIQAISDASTAQSTADGKIVSFYQDSAPTNGISIGDFWIDTDDGNTFYRYNGSSWESAQDNDIINALNAAQTAQTTADGKAIVYYSNEAPIDAAIGDLWYDTNDPLKTLRRSSGIGWDVIATYGATWNIDIVGQPASLDDLDSTAYAELQDALTNSIQAISDASNAQATADGKILSFYQTTAPTVGMSEGDFWFDIDNGKKLYRYSGTTWISAQDDEIALAIDAAQTAQTTADGKAIVYYSPTTPVGATIGDLWYDDDDEHKRFYRYSGSEWSVVASWGATWGFDIANEPGSLNDINSEEYEDLVVAATNAEQALLAAASAQSTADGKIASYYQDEAPTVMDVGDFWIDTNDGNRLRRYNGVVWVDAQDIDIAAAINAAQTAQTIADGKAFVFYSDTTPTEATNGDLWYDTNDPDRSLNRYNGTTWDVVSTKGATWGDIVNQPTDPEILNSYVVVATNVLPNSGFSNGTTGWTFGGTSGATTASFNTDWGIDWTLAGEHTGYIRQPDGDGDLLTDYNYLYSVIIPSLPNVNYCYSGYFGAHKCRGRLALEFLDENYNSLGFSSDDQIFATDNKLGGKYLSGYKRLSIFSTSPGGTKFIRAWIYKHVTDDGEIDSFLFFSRMQLAYAASNQVETPEYTPYGTDGATWDVNVNNQPVSLNDISAAEYLSLIDPAGTINEGSSTLDGGKITTYSILAQQLAALSVTAYAVGANQIVTQSANIATAIINNAHLQNAIIDNAKMAVASIREANIADLEVTNGKIGNLAVSTLKIQDQAVTVPLSTYIESSETVYADRFYTIQQLTIEATGAPILLLASVKFAWSGDTTGLVRIERDSTLVGGAQSSAIVTAEYRALNSGDAVNIIITNITSPGTHIYYVRAKGSLGAVDVSHKAFSLIETKK